MKTHDQIKNLAFQYLNKHRDMFTRFTILDTFRTNNDNTTRVVFIGPEAMSDDLTVEQLEKKVRERTYHILLKTPCKDKLNSISSTISEDFYEEFKFGNNYYMFMFLSETFLEIILEDCQDIGIDLYYLKKETFDDAEST